MDERGWDGPDAPDEPFEADPEEPYVRSGVMRTVALVLILALAATYAGAYLISALRRSDPAVPLEAVADPKGFKFLAIDPTTQQPVRYDPCTPLRWVFNPANAPSGGFRDVRQAVDLTADATGIDFVYEGETDEPVGAARDPIQPDRYGDRWAPLLIGWMAHDSEIFAIDDVGVAGSAVAENGKGQLVYVSGRIALNGSEQLANGFAPGKTWGKVTLHELGHVLGLDHVEDPAQVMHASLISSPAAWGTGDLAGLTQLGHLAGCIDVPAPG